MNVRDRTQTAVQSPLSAAEVPDTAVLLMVGSGDRPGLPAARRFTVVRDELEIGRRPSDEAEARGAALAIPDALVSSQHARIVRRGPGELEIVDLDSKNGTFVDNVRVEDRARLRNGSLLFFGNHIALFRMASAMELEAVKADRVAPL